MRLSGSRSLIAAAAIAWALGAPTAAYAQATYSYNMPAQDLGRSLRAVARRTGANIVFDPASVRGKTAPALHGNLTLAQAIGQLLAGSNLGARQTAGGSWIIAPSGEAAAGSAAADDGSAAQEEIVVTGSNIRGVEYQASPVQRITKTDIERSGATDLAGVLRNIAQNFQGGPFGATPDGRSGDGDLRAANDSGSIAPNLRGLGNSSTLTLINGRRLAPTAQSNVTDISMIPIAAIDRIEILSDGASAIYGGDAIGGVVNILLRRDYDGVEASFYGLTDDGGDYTHLRGNVAAGTHWGTGNVMVAGSIGRYTPLRSSQRSFTSPAITGDGLIQAYIYPAQRDYSAFASVTQRLLDGVEFGSDVWWGHRNRLQYTTGLSTALPNSYEQQRARVDEVNAASSLKIDLPASWRLTLDGVFSQSLEETERRTITTATQRLDNNVDFSIYSGQAKLDGTVFSLPAGEVKVALGGEWRREHYYIEQFFGLITAPASLSARGQTREIRSVFGELLVPLVGGNRGDGAMPHRVDLSLAGRYTDYSDFGDTFNYKVGVRAELIQGFAFRGTYSTSFRPPDLDREARRTFGRTLSESLNRFLSPTGSGTVSVIQVGGTSALGPETSRAITAGVDFAPPGSRFAVNLTWFRYNFTNRLGQVNLPVDILRRASEFAPLITPVTSVDQVQALVNEVLAENGINRVNQPYSRFAYILDASFRNLSTQRVSGVDVSVSYSHDLGQVSLTHSASGTVIFQDDRRITVTSSTINALARYGEQPEFKARASSTASYRGGSFTIGASYISALKNDNIAGIPPISDWVTVDLALRIPIGLGRRSAISLAVLNLFDRDPPFAQRIGRIPQYDPANANPLGRQFSAQLTLGF